MELLSTMIAGINVGSALCSALAALTGTNAVRTVTTGTAVGTLIGAGTTAAACTVQGTGAAARQLA